MSNETFRIRRLDDTALHDVFIRAADAARAGASADSLSGAEVQVSTEFFGISILGLLNLEETPPKPGSYMIKTARLSLQTTTTVDRHRPSEPTTIRLVLSRGAENELDQLQISREGSSGDDRWREGRGRAAVISAFDVLNSVIAPSNADPGTAIGQLSNFAENIDRSFRGFTQGVEGFCFCSKLIDEGWLSTLQEHSVDKWGQKVRKGTKDRCSGFLSARVNPVFFA